jgi:hypothetical protein
LDRSPQRKQGPSAREALLPLLAQRAANKSAFSDERSSNTIPISSGSLHRGLLEEESRTAFAVKASGIGCQRIRASCSKGKSSR